MTKLIWLLVGSIPIVVFLAVLGCCKVSGDESRKEEKEL